MVIGTAEGTKHSRTLNKLAGRMALGTAFGTGFTRRLKKMAGQTAFRTSFIGRLKSWLVEWLLTSRTGTLKKLTGRTPFGMPFGTGFIVLIQGSSGRTKKISFERNRIDNSTNTLLSNETVEKTHGLRQLMGEELQRLNIEELHKLEELLEESLRRVLNTKDERFQEEISALKRKGAQLMEDNQRLKKRLENQFNITTHVIEQGQSSVSADLPQDQDQDNDDTSLKLGLPFPN
ncbi:hypothetical protein SLA2020_435510 [Shorea laevis]